MDLYPEDLRALAGFTKAFAEACRKWGIDAADAVPVLREGEELGAVAMTEAGVYAFQPKRDE